jgi:RNA polymerase sigma factor (sigma-70 family)
VDPTLSKSEDEALLPLSPDLERALVDNHQRFLLFLEHRLGNRADAEELLQESILRAIGSGKTLPDSEGAITWFYRVLRNAMVDRYRKQSVETRGVDRLAREPEATPHDIELHQAVCACMHGLLPSLKPEYADMVKQVDLEEQPLAEVARKLGVTSNNASVRLHRARQALKRTLERACGSCATHGCLDCTCGRKPSTAP